jgi:stage II sporulation protein D
MEKMIYKLRLYSKILLITCLFCSCQPHAAFSTSVRVAVVKGKEEIRLTIRGQYEIIDPVGQQVLSEGRYLRDQEISVDQGGFVWDGRQTNLEHIRILPQKDVAISFDGIKKRYRDIIDLKAQSDDRMLVVNIIALEKYVKGVLYHEVSHRWPLEALKAQAVAARTYALYQTKVNSQRDYDVTSDIYSQVYGGKSAERYRTNLAVNRTKDEVLFFQDQVLPAYYHSNCGGHTEDVSELWDHDLPPLSGVQCPFCKNQPGYRWKRNFRSKEVQDLLNRQGYAIGLIKTVKVTERTDSGRVKKIQVTDRKGKTLYLTGKEFRQILGPNLLRSNLYKIRMQGFYFDVIGRGWGHGVGMCQWGMHTMSRKGYSYRDILYFYYPGVEIKRSEFAEK